MSKIKAGKRFFSVVYEITNPEAFESTCQFLTGQMANETVSRGAKVSACGWGDYATSYDALEHFARAEGHDPDTMIEDYINEQELNVSSRDITG